MQYQDMGMQLNNFLFSVPSTVLCLWLELSFSKKSRIE